MARLTMIVPVLASACVALAASAQFGGGYAPPPPPGQPGETPPAPPTPPTQPTQPTQPTDPTPPAGQGTQPTTPVPPAGGTAPGGSATGGSAAGGTAGGTATGSSPPDDPGTRVVCTPPEKSWIVKLPPEDRAALEPSLGYLLPPPTLSVHALDGTAAVIPQGKILVLQSVDAASTNPTILDKLAKAIEAAKLADDVLIVAVQVPNKVDVATKKLGKFESKATILVDDEGGWCDTLGFYKKPANMVVDRGGAVRYVGLTEKGVADASRLLAAEPARTTKVATRPDLVPDSGDGRVTPGAAQFPTFTNPVTNANDLRGQPAPNLSVDTWITKPANTQGKVIVVDFFFTGCPPCRAAIPHMNELAAHYGNEVAVVGVSWETKSTYDAGAQRYRSDFGAVKYAIGLDTSKTTIGAFGVRSYPCIAVISADGIVRWQGHPSSLDAKVMDPIVAANRALVEASSKASKSKGKRGWVQSPS